MAFRDDDRGQAIQIGAVLLFAVLVIAFSLYQAFIVPNQNQQVEANHLQTVEGQMQDLRDGIVNVPRTGDGQSVRVAMGTTYPARAVALNPPPPAGQLRTLGTADERVNFTVANARAIDRETADYWNGTNRTRETGHVVYSPDYNEFRDPPRLVYDTTTLSSQFDDSNLWTTGQTLVNGRRITLVAIDGSYDRSSSRSVSIDLEAISASMTDIAITNNGSEKNVTITFTSQRSASDWRSLLVDAGQWDNRTNGYVVSVNGTSITDRFDRITLELARNETYNLRMAKVGIGTQTTGANTTYITSVGPTNVRPNEVVVAEVRDEFNNPVSGVEVTPNVRSGTCDIDSRQTDSFGQVNYQCADPAQIQLGIGDRDYEMLNVTIIETGSEPQEGKLIYNDDAAAYDGPDIDRTTGGVEFTLTNNHSQDIIIGEVRINDTSSGNINRINDQVTPNGPPRSTEIYIAADQNNGWVDIDDGVDLPYQFDLDTDGFSNNGNATLSAGENARIYLYEFENRPNNRVDMSGKSFTTTVFYETASGTSYTEQFRITIPR